MADGVYLTGKIDSKTNHNFAHFLHKQRVGPTELLLQISLQLKIEDGKTLYEKGATDQELL